MKFFQKMERKFGRYAIHNLMYYIIVLYLVGLGIAWLMPGFYVAYLSLDPAMILRGQIWRIFTFIIYPPTTDPFFAIFVFLLYYSLGRSLERVWGAFRFNVYILMGIVFHVAAALILYLVFGSRVLLTTTYLNASVFFAYAASFPNDTFFIYFVLPVKAKWLAAFEGFFYVLMFFTGGMGTRVEILMSLANFLIFFFMTRNYQRVNPREIKRRRDFQVQMRPVSRARHRCAVCGRTDEDSPGMEFRYCSKCEGDYEYCMDHLYTHKHIKKSDLGQQSPDSGSQG